MQSRIRARSSIARISLLAAACLHIAGAVAIPALHRHTTAAADVAYSPDELPGRGTLHQHCEACTAHGAAVLPAAVVATATVPSTNATSRISTHAPASTQLLAHARARAPPVS